MIVYRILLAGKAKDVFRDLALITRLAQRTGMVLCKYYPDLKANSQN